MDGPQTRRDVQQGFATASTRIVLVLAVLAVAVFLALALAANIGAIR